jgi:hypothetical protein
VSNLAPADLKKDAGGFDLPMIALGLLLGSGQVAFDRPASFAIVGELAGETRPIKGVHAMAFQAVAEKRTGLLVPTANGQGKRLICGVPTAIRGRRGSDHAKCRRPTHRRNRIKLRRSLGSRQATRSRTPRENDGLHQGAR